MSKQIDTVAPMLKICVLKGGCYGWNRNFLHVYDIEWHCSCPVEILRYQGRFMRIERCQTTGVSKNWHSCANARVFRFYWRFIRMKQKLPSCVSCRMTLFLSFWDFILLRRFIRKEQCHTTGVSIAIRECLTDRTETFYMCIIRKDTVLVLSGFYVTGGDLCG